MHPPKTAIIGGTGCIGGAFLSAYRAIYPDCIATSRNREEIETSRLMLFDLLSPDISSLRLAETGHKEVIVSAGISRLLVCEQEKEYTKKITEGTIELVRQLAEENIKPVYISTDAVFDGKAGGYADGAQANPLNEYGKQKREIEQAVSELCGKNFLIIRLGKVFTLDSDRRNIFEEMAHALVAGKKVRAAYDQIFSITLLSDAIGAVMALQAKGMAGIVNVSSPEVWSRYDLAVTMADYLEVSRDLVERISLEGLKEPFLRPKNTTMMTKRLDSEIGYKFTDIKECVKKVSMRWINKKIRVTE